MNIKKRFKFVNGKLMIPLKVKVITERDEIYEPHETHLVCINKGIHHAISDEQTEFLINKMKHAFYGYGTNNEGLVSVEGLVSLKLIFDFDEN